MRKAFREDCEAAFAEKKVCAAIHYCNARLCSVAAQVVKVLGQVDECSQAGVSER